MKKILFLLIILVLNSGYTAEVGIYATPHCPFSCKDKTGLVYEMMDRFFNTQKIKTKNELIPWARLIEISKKKGSVDIFAPAIPDAAPHLWFPDFPIAYDEFCFFKKEKINWSFEKVESLKKVKLVVVKGYVYQELDIKLMDYIKENSKEPSRIHYLHGELVAERGIDMINAKRADVFLTSKIITKYLFPNKKHNIGYCYKPNYYLVGLNKKNESFQKLKKLVNRDLKKLIKEGFFDDLYEKYNLDPKVLKDYKKGS